MKTKEDLRDEFAAAALTGLLASIADNGARQTVEEEAQKACLTPVAYIARLAYQCADAALAYRDANPLPAP